LATRRAEARTGVDDASDIVIAAKAEIIAASRMGTIVRFI